jgi:hypothetical protein
MAKGNQPTKPKEMFKVYNPDTVPESMPLPELSHVATTKGQETAVPKLNEYQRSWILDVGIRGADFLSLDKKAAEDLYDKVKSDAFNAKAFQHTPQPSDRDEEARLPELITAWHKKKGKNKAKSADDDEGNASDQEEDELGRGALLRGYSKAGWRIVSIPSINISFFFLNAR